MLKKISHHLLLVALAVFLYTPEFSHAETNKPAKKLEFQVASTKMNFSGNCSDIPNCEYNCALYHEANTALLNCESSNGMRLCRTQHSAAQSEYFGLFSCAAYYYPNYF